MIGLCKSKSLHEDYGSRQYENISGYFFCGKFSDEFTCAGNNEYIFEKTPGYQCEKYSRRGSGRIVCRDRYRVRDPEQAYYFSHLVCVCELFYDTDRIWENDRQGDGGIHNRILFIRYLYSRFSHVFEKRHRDQTYFHDLSFAGSRTHFIFLRKNDFNEKQRDKQRAECISCQDKLQWEKCGGNRFFGYGKPAI